MASYAEIKAKLQQEGKKIRKRSSYDEHNLQAAWLKEEGMKAGVSDMLLLKRTSQYGFLCIENKTPKGRQEPEQKVFQYEVERHGGKYIIVRSIDEFIQAIDNYLNGEL